MVKWHAPGLTTGTLTPRLSLLHSVAQSLCQFKVLYRQLYLVGADEVTTFRGVISGKGTRNLEMEGRALPSRLSPSIWGERHLNR